MPLTLIFSIKISILPSARETHNILDCLPGSVTCACQFNLWLDGFGWLGRWKVEATWIHKWCSTCQAEDLAPSLRDWTHGEDGAGRFPVQPA